MPLPVCILSPICSSDIDTDLPSIRLTLDVAGKHPPDDDDGGGVAVVVVVTRK